MLNFYESRELTEATMKYVAGLKLAYPALNERDLYEMVYEVARQRVEEAQEVSRNRY